MDKTRRYNLTEEQVPCGCGRSPTGFCIGLHEMSEVEYEKYLIGEDDDKDVWKESGLG
jgi:hypothetical protein